MREASELARRFVEATARGDDTAAALAEELALALGEALEPANRLIAATLAGGPFAVRRALELALLVAPGNADRFTTGGQGGASDA